jgi:YVTN family beta-propeller protein
MAGLKISQLTDGVGIGSADSMAAVRSGANVKVQGNRLNNNTWLVGRNATNTADVNILRLNTAGQVEFGFVPISLVFEQNASGVAPNTLKMPTVNSKVIMACHDGSKITITDLITRVTTDVAIGGTPQPPIISPDGTLVAVACHGSQTTYLITIATAAAGSAISTPGGPVASGFTPDGTKCFVDCADNNPSILRRIDVASRTNDANHTFDNYTGMTMQILVTPDGSKVCVPGWARDDWPAVPRRYYVVNPTTMARMGTVNLTSGDNSWQDVTNTTAYLTSRANGLVNVINLSTYTLTTTIAVGAEPWWCELTADESMLVVAAKGANQVVLIDTATNTISTTIPVTGGPQMGAISSKTNRAYIGCFTSGEIAIIDLTTRTLIGKFPARVGPSGISIAENGTGIVAGGYDPTGGFEGFRYFQPYMML